MFELFVTIKTGMGAQVIAGSPAIIVAAGKTKTWKMTSQKPFKVRLSGPNGPLGDVTPGYTPQFLPVEPLRYAL